MNLRLTFMKRALSVTLFAGAVCVCAALAVPEERTQRFDRDPGWEGRNHRPAAPATRTIRQDFGYSPRTSHAGRAAGELGGFATPAAEPAYYAKAMPPRTFDDALSASGTLLVGSGGTRDDGNGHVLLGFFNAGTLNEWRTPNTIALRISGRGNVFYAWVEYCTSRWRAGGDDPRGFPTTRDPQTGRAQLTGFATGVPHTWSLTYDPRGNNNGGVVTAVIDGVTAVCHLADGHRADGATFNRFGLLNVMKSADSGGEFWLDDVNLNGATESFNTDPKWEGVNNRRTHATTNIRPIFDFGWSASRFAGGTGRGEVGGLFFRGDCRYPERMACYGDRLEPLTLDRPLRAAGRVVLRRGVTDSSTLFGFYHSDDSMRSNPSQTEGTPENFLGIAIEGPSRDGFLFYPLYRSVGEAKGNGSRRGAPFIYPDGKSHAWSLEYAPTGNGSITVALDGESVTTALAPGHRTGARFNRFGFITSWIDGNGQEVYLDDLRYTGKQ